MSATTLLAGPFKGVRDTKDPYDDPADPAYLQDAQNIYVPDPDGLSGTYARPGFILTTPSYAHILNGTYGIYTHTYITGAAGTSSITFVSALGKLWRLSGANFGTATDVTPVGIAIAQDTSTTFQRQHYMASLNGALIFSDGSGRPWVGTNLTATPITGAYIDIDGAAGAWSALGKPVVYKGAVYFIARTVPVGSAVQVGPGIVWSEPNQPTVGYTQAGYTDFWNVIEQSEFPIYALAADNNYLWYFRESSIGALAGAPGSNFSTTATRDMVSVNVGSLSPNIVQFGDNIFFVDKQGRPWKFTPGTVPVALWKQLRGQIDANPSWIAAGYAQQYLAVAALVPQLNIVLMGAWLNDGTDVTTLYAFDAVTGMYYGRWSGASTLIHFNLLEKVIDSNGNATVAAYCVTTAAGPTYTGKLWLLSLLSDANWKDNSVVPTITAKTQRLGYSADKVWSARGIGTVVQQGTAPLTVTVQTPYTASTTECTAQAANASQDGTNRVVFGMDVRSARGIQVTVQPTTATAQWVLQNISFPAVPSKARPEDQ